ncbi:Transcriptional regulatory protein ZraR [Posidoniimonas corsicana]|uniref:Transcriptional regulatory protein ZraR n=1 Tax=Posidoniimonas corsicana TaxID=1938618 RepID=A0A5C5V676_9BACT|nr:helix-turn-helix domain-containing protein [Posidoniimonas corsicana]TWT34058.1 Transcriptional regulatory protein ZraR [Posidoniimonas corsicana]
MHDLRQLYDASRAPAYAVTPDGVVAYANAALCAWVSLPVESVVGRKVAYHSEPTEGGPPGASTGPLTGLCPPPLAFQQPTAGGALSVMGQDGRLRHRQAVFSSFELEAEPPRRAVVAVLDDRDLTPQELAASLSEQPAEDVLHRDIRRFRRGRNEPDATALLLGDSPAARLLRSQFDLALRSAAGALVTSPCGQDSAALARAIHYGAHDPQAPLLPIDFARLDADAAAALLNQHAGRLQDRATVLLLSPDAAASSDQSRIADQLLEARPHRLLATATAGADSLAPPLRALVATLSLHSPPLAERDADLPIMVQYYLERANSLTDARVGRANPEAVDLLSIYDWPNGAAQLGEAVAAAHAACVADSPHAVEIEASHLPPVVRHAALAAGLGADGPESVDLDALLRRIERELIERALDKANHNKAEAARLLGLTRQRFYRRLESLVEPDSSETQDASVNQGGNSPGDADD